MAHNHEVVGSNPTPAIVVVPWTMGRGMSLIMKYKVSIIVFIMVGVLAYIGCIEPKPDPNNLPSPHQNLNSRSGMWMLEWGDGSRSYIVITSRAMLGDPNFNESDPNFFVGYK